MPETKLESRTPRAADTAQPQPKSHGLALKDRRHLAVTGSIVTMESKMPLCWKRRSAT